MLGFMQSSVKSSTAFISHVDDFSNAITTHIGVEVKKNTWTPLETHTTDAHDFYRTEDRSRTLGELQQDPLFGRLWRSPKPESTVPDLVETARNHRLAILAREFEGAELTREDKARLAILTQRLRKLVPRVTTKSWTIAEEGVAQLEDISARIDDIGARYGL